MNDNRYICYRCVLEAVGTTSSSDENRELHNFESFIGLIGNFLFIRSFFILFLIFLLNLYSLISSRCIFLQYMWSYSLKRAFHFGDRTSQSFFISFSLRRCITISLKKAKKERNFNNNNNKKKNKRVRRHTHRDIFLAWCQQLSKCLSFAGCIAVSFCCC